MKFFNFVFEEQVHRFREPCNFTKKTFMSLLRYVLNAQYIL